MAPDRPADGAPGSGGGAVWDQELPWQGAVLTETQGSAPAEAGSAVPTEAESAAPAGTLVAMPAEARSAELAEAHSAELAEAHSAVLAEAHSAVLAEPPDRPIVRGGPGRSATTVVRAESVVDLGPVAAPRQTSTRPRLGILTAGRFRFIVLIAGLVGAVVLAVTVANGASGKRPLPSSADETTHSTGMVDGSLQVSPAASAPADPVPGFAVPSSNTAAVGAPSATAGGAPSVTATTAGKLATHAPTGHSGQTTKAAPPPPAPVTTTARAPAITGPSGHISGYVGMCLHVAYSQTADGTQIEMYTCGNAEAFTWQMASDGTIRALGKCMEVEGSATADGTRVSLHTCDGAAGQQWRFTAGNDIVNPHADKCLDVKDMQTFPGIPVQLWSCAGTSNQKWAVP
jgi:hypothetical protein